MSKTDCNVDPEDFDTLVRCLLQAKQTIEKIKVAVNSSSPDDARPFGAHFRARTDLVDLEYSIRKANREAMNVLLELGFDIDFTINKVA